MRNEMENCMNRTKQAAERRILHVINRRIVILAAPPFDELNVVGVFQVFGTANDFFPEHAKPYRIQVASASAESKMTGYSGLSILPDLYYRDVRDKIDTLLLASGPVSHSDVDMDLLQWIIRWSRKVRRLGSICSGAFLLAETGLLDGRRATTHWAHVKEFGARFPKVLLDPDPIWLRDGNIYTSAGVTSGMDLALALVEEDLGSKVALAVARQLVLFLRRPGGQSQFSRLLEAQASSRGPLREVLVWAVENLDKDLSVENLALHAAMSRRNFTRVFTAELGTSPAHYIEQLRIEAARHLLEDSWKNLEEIASACGFSSAELMRRTFLRLIGITASEYRERFRSAGNTPVRSPVPFSPLIVAAGNAA
jgi:transcriptional regulator GlxA family with amidase domain